MSETIDIVQPVLERHHRMREMCSSSPPTYDSLLTHLLAQLSCLQCQSIESLQPVLFWLKEVMTLMGLSSTAEVRGSGNFSYEKLIDLQGQNGVSEAH